MENLKGFLGLLLVMFGIFMTMFIFNEVIYMEYNANNREFTVEIVNEEIKDVLSDYLD